jgi:hypothetical protein
MLIYVIINRHSNVSRIGGKGKACGDTENSILVLVVRSARFMRFE